MANIWHNLYRSLFGYRGLHVWRALCAFGFSFALVVLIVLVIGNAQDFLERTQLLLLLILQYSFLFSLCAGVYYTAANVIHRHDRKFGFGLVGGLLSITGGLVGTIMVIFVRVLIGRA